MPLLYIVATPIGNLGDLSPRAIKVLKKVDLILGEDTRVTKKILNSFNIDTPVISYHQHSKLRKKKLILDRLNSGDSLALVSDSGTPGISDPGNKLIELAQENLSDLKVIPIPGPSAVTAIASISGFPTNKFLFLGFPPSKRKRKQYFQKIIDSDYSVIFYESCHRIIKTLEQLREMDPQLEIVVGRELTKKFESIYRGKIGEVINQIKQDKKKGEFSVAVKR